MDNESSPDTASSAASCWVPSLQNRGQLSGAWHLVTVAWWTEKAQHLRTLCGLPGSVELMEINLSLRAFKCKPLFWQTQHSQDLMGWALEKWLSSSEFWMLSYRTWVRLPGLTWQLTSVTPVPGDPVPSCTNHTKPKHSYAYNEK